MNIYSSIRRLLAALLIITISVQTIGCSLVGYGIGSAIDYKVLPYSEKLNPNDHPSSANTKVSLELKNGYSSNGYFHGRYENNTIRFSAENIDEIPSHYPRLKNKNQKGWEIVLVPKADIISITVPKHPGRGVYLMTSIGLAVDLAIIIGFIVIFNDMRGLDFTGY